MCFSRLKLTYGALRTRLGIEKAAKLGFVYKVFHNKNTKWAEAERIYNCPIMPPVLGFI